MKILIVGCSGYIGSQMTQHLALAGHNVVVLDSVVPGHARIDGYDYATRDGTCERDYVHVSDIANAHWLALDHLITGGISGAFNVGSGTGYTVGEVIAAARRITRRDMLVQSELHRAGDPARLIADTRKAREMLGWTPSRSDLNTLLKDACRWEQIKGTLV